MSLIQLFDIGKAIVIAFHQICKQDEITNILLLTAYKNIG